MGILDNILKQNKLDPEDFKEADDSGIKRITGKVVKVNSEEGWGFIISPDMKFTRFFFHWTALAPFHITDLKKGAQVEFTPINLPEKGWRANKIKIIKNGE